jgi:hypothetical protein
MSFTFTPGPDTVDGSEIDDSGLAQAGNDLVDGRGGNDTIAGEADNDTLIGGSGDDVLLGGDGDDSLDGGTESDRLEGGSGNDTLSGVSAGALSADTLDGGAGDDLIILGESSEAVIGGGGNDTINILDYAPAGTWTLTGSTWTDGVVSINGAGGTLSFTDDGGTFFSDPNAVCFAAGTRILTARGEVEVEMLRAGDLVATLSGQGAPMKPVLWIGRRHVALADLANAAEVAPVRIAAGALGEHTPHRDLLVSPDHCLFLHGMLVPSRLLVNGTTISVEAGLPAVTYFHVELAGHDILLAEGAAVESWLDTGNRAWFDNAPVAMITVASSLDLHGAGWDANRACAPLVQGGPELQAIRDAIALRAGAPASDRRTAAA